MAEELSANVDNVFVLTGKPNYPNGDIYLGYSAFGLQIERQKSFTIFRVPLIPRGKGGAIKMLLNYLSFIISALFLAPILLRKLNIDVIFVYGTSPLIQGISAIPLRYQFKAKLITWVQDLWPEDLASTGYITNKFLLKINEWPARLLYFFSDRILVQSNAFLGPVRRLTSNPEIYVLPNPAERHVFFQNRSIEIPKLMDQMLGKFNVVFAGNIGNNQSIQTIIEAAEIIKYHKEIQIIMVGSGSYSERLKQEISERNLNNLVAVGRYDSEYMPSIFECSDALLVTLGAKENLGWTVPCKVQTYMAAGRPIIGSISGEGKLVIEASGAGLTADAEDPVGLANCIIQLFGMDSQSRAVMGNAGRQFAEKNYHPQKISQILMDHFKSALGGKG
ncbi:glycosyltransferase family 4 protein [Polynucleobacter sp. MWH-Braz-FAM2G]|uniref:glycosyltransferase family 4 protein n=1 Tax=Polynucleobacter sp. MWH-Braz-FAM2G TaxID=1855883 RepID=UPI001BFD011A|nr:glycosyltransferase family 4 protein [Polynucleobacter sp. MWH-Braz-FAM2G]QWD91104.1 glycosyltransferase family 4 protein [Polynucleobacter sp. MWH-Braz-FAM2G]